METRASFPAWEYSWRMSTRTRRDYNHALRFINWFWWISVIIKFSRCLASTWTYLHCKTADFVITHSATTVYRGENISVLSVSLIVGCFLFNFRHCQFILCQTPNFRNVSSLNSTCVCTLMALSVSRHFLSSTKAFDFQSIDCIVFLKFLLWIIQVKSGSSHLESIL